MGNSCVMCMNEEQREAYERNRRIEEMHKQTYEEESRKVKLLLLGAGESGKSTLFKQMKILYGKGSTKSGFSEQERASMKSVIHQNIIANFRALLYAPSLNLAQYIKQQANNDSEPMVSETPLSKESRETAISILKLNLRTATPEELKVNQKMAEALKGLWNDPAIQKVWSDRGSMQVQDALAYYMKPENFKRIADEDYVANDQDILRSRVRTSGIVEELFEIGKTTFLMVDVGGQRNERRKWIHAFDAVDCILFVAAISEYNQVLYEDTSVRRQEESIELFGKVAHEDAFKNVGLVLFLNKSDLFREKLLKIPFRVDTGTPEEQRNVDYTGPVLDLVRPGGMSDKEFENSAEFEEMYAQSLHYLEKLYQKQVPAGKEVYIKATCATDTEQVSHIMTACTDIFLKRNLKNSGFM